jgi:hypothetical protein
MSIRASAGAVQLVINNFDRPNGIPPLMFHGLSTGTDQNFSFCIWVRPTSNIPSTLLGLNCEGGSQMIIINDGTNWIMTMRKGAVALPNINIGPVIPQDLSAANGLRWTLFCFVKNGPTMTVYRGMEDSYADGAPYVNPVTISQVAQVDYDINAAFYSFVVVAYAHVEITCFKFWNAALTMSQLQVQAHRWDDQTGGSGPTPIWASTLRTPGDISSIANPYSGGDWGHWHSYSGVIPGDGLSSLRMGGGIGGWNDPAYLTNNMPCPTWLYPIGHPTSCNFNPGLTPAVPTIYKAPQFFQFTDKGSVPHVDVAIQSIKYWGNIASNSGEPGVGPTDHWALYKDENNVEISNLITLPEHRFENGGVTVPPGLKATTMYLWKFGGQFTYPAPVPQVPTTTGYLNYIFLYVNYIGYPSGIPFVSTVDLSGLFVTAKAPDSSRVDIYNNAVNLKIPDPTIKTAYIGE